MLLNKYTMLGPLSDDYYFIITAGPTGTGKSSLVDKTLEHLGIDQKGVSIKKFLIDDYVEKNTVFKNDINGIIERVTKECIGEDKKCEDEKYEQNAKKFTDIYFNARVKIPCNNNTEFTCSKLLDVELEESIKNNEKIIVFETTFGSSSLNWIFDLVPAHYKIILVFSFVDYSTLKERIKSRFKESLTKYKADKTLNAPRLVETQNKVFIGVIESIINNLYNFYKECFSRDEKTSYRDEKVCGAHRLNRLLISNNTVSHQFAYDSGESKDLLPSPEYIEGLVRSIISLPPHSTESKSGGMTKKTSAKIYKKECLKKSKSSNKKKSKKKYKKISKKKSKKSKPR